MTEVIVRVHRPELTDEERARRMKLIKKAAAQLVASTNRKEQKQ